MSAEPVSHPVLAAAAWMTGALISFLAMAVGARELSAELGTFEILFFRSAIGLVLVLALLPRRGWGQLLSRRIGLHALRNLAHFAGQFAWFYGIALLPLAEVFAIEFTVPIWTAILSVVLLGERLSGPRVVAIALGVAGALIILRPGVAVINPASLVVLLGAVGYALSHTWTRKLALSDTPLTILFYMTVIQLPLGLVPALGDWVTPSPAAWPWLLAVGLTGISAHYCMTRALALADATVVVPMDFLRLPLIAVVGFAVYDEPLDVFVLAGATVMFVGNFVNIRAEKLRLTRA